MDTTISDLPKFIAALVRGDGLSTASRAEVSKPQLHIGTAHQFAPFLPDLPSKDQRKDLSAGLELSFSTAHRAMASRKVVTTAKPLTPWFAWRPTRIA